MLEHALAINEATYGLGHPAVAKALTNLGNAHEHLQHLLKPDPTAHLQAAANDATPTIFPTSSFEPCNSSES